MASRRNYLSQAELAEFADITIIDATEADDQISQAEEMIDAYVGPQDKLISYEVRGLVAAGGASSFTLSTEHQSNMQDDYLRGCQIEIMGGTGEGQKRRITGQTFAGVITVDSAFSPAVDTTSYYRIWQLGKFPRGCDTQLGTNSKYYKTIPEAVRRAVAAQVEYIINMGTTFFSTDASNKTSESIGDYAYSKGGPGFAGSGSDASMIAPKARQLLRGILNRTGQIV